MSLITGKVEKVWENKKEGAKTTYSVVVGGVKYGTYINKPSCAEGDHVTFEATQNGNFWNMNVKSLRKTDPPADSPAAAPAASKPAWVKDTATQDAINYQSARKDALVFVEMLHTMGLLDVGTAKGKKIEVVETYLDGYTKRFFHDTKSLGHKEEVEEAAPTGDGFEDDDIPF